MWKFPGIADVGIIAKLCITKDSKDSQQHTHDGYPTMVSNVSSMTGGYPGFFSMKRLEVFVLSPWIYAGPRWGYPQQFARFLILWSKEITCCRDLSWFDYQPLFGKEQRLESWRAAENEPRT